MQAYGGINPHQWHGKPVFISGWTITEDLKIKKISVGGGYISEGSSQHVTSDEREFTIENLDLETGVESKDGLLKYFGLNSHRDWAYSRFYVVPETQPSMLANTLISGYGHDDRACLFTAMRALFSARQPAHTCVLFGMDKEEVGSASAQAAQGTFFDNTLKDLIEMEDPQNWEGQSSEVQRRYDKIIQRSKAINADTDIGSTRMDVDHIDKKSIGLLGYGMFVSAAFGGFDDFQVNPRMVRETVDLLVRKNIRAQIIGSPNKADYHEGASTESINLARKGLDIIGAGPVVASLHSPHEVVCGADMYWSTLGYQHFFESNNS